MFLPTGLPTRRKFLKRSVLGAGSLLFAPLLLDSCTDHIIPPTNPPITPPLLGDYAINWNDAAKTTVTTGLSMIPEAGEILAGLVDVFWPKDQPNPWDQVKAQTEALVNQKIADNVYQTVSDDLKGLNNSITLYLNELKNGTPSDIKTQWIVTKNLFVNALPHFQSSGYELPLLGLFTQFANLYLALLRDGVKFGQSWGRSDADHQQDINDLKQAIFNFSVYSIPVFAVGASNVEKNTQPNNHLCQPFRALNTYRRGMTSTFLDYSDTWPYYDVTQYPNGAKNPDGTPIKILTREIYSDPYGTCDNSGPIKIATPVPTQLPTKIDVWGGDRVDSVQLTYPAGSGPGGVTQTPRMGSTGSDGRNHDTLNLSPDNPIIQAKVAAGDIVNALQFVFNDGTTTKILGGGYVDPNRGPLQYTTINYTNEALSSVHINGKSNFYDSADCVVLGFEHWVSPAATLNALQNIYVKSPKERSVADFVKSFQNLAIPASLITEELKAARKAHWESVNARAKALK